MSTLRKATLCIDYLETPTVRALDCYFLEEKTDSILLAQRFELAGGDIVQVSANEIRRLAEAIVERAGANGLKLLGNVNFLVSSPKVFSYSDLFPAMKASKISKYSRRDLESSFPDYSRKTVVIQNSHDDGSLGTCVLTTMCPLDLFERLELLAKELKLGFGEVSTSNFSLTVRYEKYYAPDLPSGIVIDIERDYTLVNLFIDKIVVDDLFIPVGAAELKDEDNLKAKELLRSRILSVVAKHEFGFEKYSASIVKICSHDPLAAQRLHDYLTAATSFDVGFTVAKPLPTSKFPSRYVFGRFRKNLFAKGFTLVEVVVSLAVFSIVSGACLAAVIPLSGTVSRARREAAVGRIVADIGEIYRAGSGTSAEFAKNYREINGLTADPANRLFFSGAYAPVETEAGARYRLDYSVAETSSLTVESFVEIGRDRNLIAPVTYYLKG